MISSFLRKTSFRKEEKIIKFLNDGHFFLEKIHHIFECHTFQFIQYFVSLLIQKLKKNDKHTHEYDKQWKHNCVESVN